MKTQKHLITFSNISSDEVEAVALAKAGRSTRRIAAVTGLTVAQVNYRVTKAKKLDGFKRGHGYRTAWKDGTSEEARAYDSMFMPQIKARTVRSLAPKIGAISQFKQPKMNRRSKIKIVRKAA